MPVAAEKKIGLFSTIAVVMGSIIGAGIFMLPVSLAPLGWNAALGWLISSVGALCVAFTLSRLSRHGHGIQIHIEEIFGPTPGFVAAWAFWFANATSTGALAIAAASTLLRLEPQPGGSTLVAPTAAVFVVALTGVNALGIRASGRLQVVTTLIKVMPLVGVIVLLILRRLHGAQLHSLAINPISVGSIAAAVTLTLFALTGFENVTAPVNKIGNPSRTLPRAMIGGTALVALLYVFSSMAVSLLVGPTIVATSAAPFVDALASEWGEVAISAAVLCIAVSAFGCVSVGILAAGELAYAMAQCGDLPEVLARTRRDGTPVFSHCFVGALAVILILLNANKGTASLFTFIILISTVGTLIMYLIGSVGAFVTSRNGIGRFIMAAAIAFTLFAFYGAGFEANAWGILLVLMGLIARFCTRLARTRRATAAT
jgi:basic amino acid/polyamine antiporter, APA family